ncbi:transcriptional regulator, GntR family [Desulfonispora thiosulfatigenes DSM 11270]|uniref:Transcriptional regulator, GntR family n=1 Tax=Desulfonispora thiosulfatigenes DSM 11270 TaxID=656914 RepID=A0A1W1UZY8_DESTI|nr:GntR family transcriptional regulator [Desulfonispora thiosulfatigenes]SMB86667.1 transcriptional regulator, GntR family [Desulfonispora thiosulfatigenes DSM 11270]
MKKRTKRLLPVQLDGYKPLREIVFETLRDAIINQTLRPGERLMEIQLAEEMGVSRTPVREAIRKLELEGFAVMVPRKGAYVAGISIKDINEVFEIRGALEVLAVGLAAQRITEEEIEEIQRHLIKETEETEANNLRSIVEIDTTFHDLLYKAARNQKLLQIINNLQEQLHRFRSASLARPGRGMVALEEHKKIIEALIARDVDLAKQLAKTHIEKAEQTFLLSLEKQGLYTDED